MTIIYKDDPPVRRVGKLQIVWNRDKPRYELSLKAFRVIRPSEKECLEAASTALKSALEQVSKLLQGK